MSQAAGAMSWEHPARVNKIKYLRDCDFFNLFFFLFYCSTDGHPSQSMSVHFYVLFFFCLPSTFYFFFVFASLSSVRPTNFPRLFHLSLALPFFPLMGNNIYHRPAPLVATVTDLLTTSSLFHHPHLFPRLLLVLHLFPSLSPSIVLFCFLTPVPFLNPLSFCGEVIWIMSRPAAPSVSRAARWIIG